MQASLVVLRGARFSVVASAGLLALSCNRSPDPPTRIGVTEVPDAMVMAAAVVENPGPPKAPPDLDAEGLMKQLHCPDRRHAHACRILRDFSDATRGLAPVPSGQGRWLGKGYRVEKGRERGELTLLGTAGVQSGPIEPPDLPLRVAMT